ncbi:MAG: hypothetical protein HKP02_09265 [Xanthomonadales bacterium]|nr:hypothetical protein [Xanthomonadales bacterium]
MGVFLGVTSETRREGSFTLGLEYSRRIGEHYGVGAVLEHVFADHEFNVFAVSFARYVGPWKLYLAPGVEDSKDHDAEFLLRAGLEYAFQAGSMEIAPQFNVDFVDGDTVFVLGLTIGKGF